MGGSSLERSREGDQPLDLGCGALVPIRVTDAAMIGMYHYSLRRPARMLTQTNPAYAINVTVAGRWRYRYGRRSYDLAPGAVTVGLPGQQYACAHVPAHPNSNFLLGLAPQAVESEFEPLFKKPVMVIDELNRYITRAAGCVDDEEFESTMCEIFDIASRYSLEGSRRELSSGMRIQRMKRFIEHHLSDPITLADLADVVGLSPYTALRQFKASTGETPLEFITRLRVEMAKALLKSEKAAIEEIARRAGFKTHAYFCRTFKRYTGFTPSSYRKIERRA